MLNLARDIGALQAVVSGCKRKELVGGALMTYRLLKRLQAGPTN